MKKGDKIASLIISIILAITFGIYIYHKFFYNASNVIAIVKQNDKVIKKIELNTINHNETFKVFYNDKEYNTIKVEKGRIRFHDASCKDKICVKSGWLEKPGETSVCLPHRLSIIIQGTNNDIDDISY